MAVDGVELCARLCEGEEGSGGSRGERGGRRELARAGTVNAHLHTLRVARRSDIALMVQDNEQNYYT